jgi:hypothetical protein
MAACRSRPNIRLNVERLESREAPSASPWLSESFDSTPVGGLPSGWTQWSSNGSAAFAVSSSWALSAPNALAVTATLSKLALLVKA